jgi:hypothetical protein
VSIENGVSYPFIAETAEEKKADRFQLVFNGKTSQNVKVNQVRSFVVFPNPSMDQFQVLDPRNEINQLVVINAMGQEVYSDQVRLGQVHAMNLESLSPGMYQLLIKHNGGTAVQTILKK